MGCGAVQRQASYYPVEDGSTSCTSKSSKIKSNASSKSSSFGALSRGMNSVAAWARRGAQAAAVDVSDVVLCQAQRADWPAPDFFVFMLENRGPRRRARTGWMAPGTPGSSSRPSAPPSRASAPSRAGTAAKEGKFFIKRAGSCGTWRIRGNALSLVWEDAKHAVSLLATDSCLTWTHAASQFRVSVLEGEPPSWFQPDFLCKSYRTEFTATTLECPVCCFELWRQPVAVLRNHSKRSCPHYLHRECASYLLRGAAICSICGERFSEVKPLPDFAREPKAWFTMVCVDSMDKTETTVALACVLPCHVEALTREINERWEEWDADGNGTISIDEFLRPERGMHAWVMRDLKALTEVKGGIQQAPVLDRTPRDWFVHWDTDKSGSLEKEELCRALVRTLCISDKGQPHIQEAREMILLVDSLWSALGYSPIERIDFEEFARPYGLLDQTLHNQAQCSYFGEDEERLLPKEAQDLVMEYRTAA